MREHTKLLMAGLGAVGMVWLIAYLIQPARGATARVTVIPPGEPLNLKLEGVWR